MKCRLNSILPVVVTILGVCVVAHAEKKDWHWWPSVLLHSSDVGESGILLTGNNGARALAYDTNARMATAVVAFAMDGNIRVVRKQGSQNTEEQPDDTPCDGSASVAVSWEASPPKKHVFWPLWEDLKVEYADTWLTSNAQPWEYHIKQWDALLGTDDVAVAAAHDEDGGDDYVCVCYWDEPEGDPPVPGVYASATTDQGANWSPPDCAYEETEDCDGSDNFSLAGSKNYMYMALHCEEVQGGEVVDCVRVRKSTNGGANWYQTSHSESDAVQPCIATFGSMIVLVWVDSVNTSPNSQVGVRLVHERDGLAS